MDKTTNENTASSPSKVPWTLLIKTTLQTFLLFYLATFSLAVYFTYHLPSDRLLSFLMGGLYAFIVIGIGIRIVQRLPLAALMLVIPIAPLIALITVITLIPVIELLH